MNEKIDKIKDLLSNLDKLTPDSIESIVGETLKVFTDVVTKLNSPDEKERNEALNLATELRDTLEGQAKNALGSLGMDEEELKAFMSNPSHFTGEEWGALEKAKNEMASYKKELVDKNLLPEEKEKQEKAKKVSKIQVIKG